MWRSGPKSYHQPAVIIILVHAIGDFTIGDDGRQGAVELQLLLLRRLKRIPAFSIFIAPMLLYVLHTSNALDRVLKTSINQEDS